MDIMLVHKHADVTTLSLVIHSLIPLMSVLSLPCNTFVKSDALILLHIAVYTPIVSLVYLSTLRLNADPS